MATLVEQRDQLKQEVELLQLTIARQSETITRLQNQLHDSVENSDFFKTQMQTFQIEIDCLKAQLEDARKQIPHIPERLPNGHRPGAKRKYDDETRKRIKDLYQAGYSMAAISEEVGASKTQIHAILHE